MIELVYLFLKDNWKLMAMAALVALLPIVYGVGHWRGDTQGYNRYAAKVAVANAKAEAERAHDNAKLQGMSDYDLCVGYLTGNGVRDISPCEQLRGVQP